jgi:hypothetical protein
VLRPGSGQRLQALLDFRERLTELLLPHVVRRHFQLPLGFRLGQAQGLYLPHLLGIDLGSTKPCLTAFLLPFFHALGKPRLGVDQSFSCITHVW